MAFDWCLNFFLFLRPASVYYEEYDYIYIYNIYIYISDCVETVFEVPSLPKNTGSETLLHKSGALRCFDSIFISGSTELR
jgi:hypothetical protein